MIELIADLRVLGTAFLLLAGWLAFAEHPSAATFRAALRAGL